VTEYGELEPQSLRAASIGNCSATADHIDIRGDQPALAGPGVAADEDHLRRRPAL
jgi:hypothetical protein